MHVFVEYIFHPYVIFTWMGFFLLLFFRHVNLEETISESCVFGTILRYTIV